MRNIVVKVQCGRSAGCALVALAVALAASRPAFGFFSNSDAPLDINFYLGAYTFYNNGYIGQNATVANIEAGFIANTHESLNFRGASLLYFSDPSLNATVPEWLDYHATAVGHALGGFGPSPVMYGITPFATVFSGAIATQWFDPQNEGFATSFDVSQRSFAGAYYQAAVSGVSNTYYYGNVLSFGTVDVITSSWGSSDAPGGDSYFTVALDAIAHKGGKLVCVSAGNGGPDRNTVGTPANGFNTLAVGALTQSRAAQGVVDYDAVADFSSRGPQDLAIPLDPDGNSTRTVRGARARVDLTAPGTSLFLAAYLGRTGGNQYLDPSFPLPSGDGYYFNGIGGTSFATPIVSGGAALLADVAWAKYTFNTVSRDGRVLKAVLMNSADKLPGWTSNAVISGGISITSQGLDYDSGAGRINLHTAYHQFLDGTADVPGTGGGAVANVGWDYAEVKTNVGASVSYPITSYLVGGTVFSATLTWYAHELIDAVTYDATYGSFYDLDLELWSVVNGVPTALVAESVSPYNSSEHIYFTLPAGGYYLLRVVNEGAVWNFVNDATVPYGIAWAGVVPEPGAMGAVVGMLAVLRRRRPGA